jgi:hypothetical protein
MKITICNDFKKDKSNESTVTTNLTGGVQTKYDSRLVAVQDRLCFRPALLETRLCLSPSGSPCETWKPKKSQKCLVGGGSIRLIYLLETKLQFLIKKDNNKFLLVSMSTEFQIFIFCI